MRNRYWIAVFAVVILVCSVVWFARSGKSDDCVVGIYQDGEMLYQIDLSQVARAYEVTVEYNGSENVILVEPGDISVISADCPDKVCVDHGSLGHRTPIVCLPNRLVIDWVDDGGRELDAVA